MADEADEERAVSPGLKSLKQVWSLRLPPPVAESGRQRLETARSAMRDYAGFPGRQPNVPHLVQPFWQSSQGAKRYLTVNL